MNIDDAEAFADSIETKQSLVDFQRTKFVSIGKPLRKPHKKRRRAWFMVIGSLSVFFLLPCVNSFMGKYVPCLR